MNFLDPIEPAQRWTVGPEWISKASKDIASLEDGLEVLDGFSDVVSASQTALVYLQSVGKVSGAIGSRLQASLDGLDERVEALGHQFCHGDLGPQNVMKDPNGLVLLDWEDVLHAFPGYDWIYWLSFFANRDLMSSEALLRSGLPEKLCRDLVAAILVVKSEISLRSGAAALYKVSIEDRLSAALELP